MTIRTICAVLAVGLASVVLSGCEMIGQMAEASSIASKLAVEQLKNEQLKMQERKGEASARPVSTPAPEPVAPGFECPRPPQSAGVLPSDKRDEVLGANRWHALLIGISCYRNPEWRLNTPAKDVQGLANLLERDYGFKTTVVCDQKATRVGIREAIDALRERVGKDDNALVYFAGHGLLRSGNVGYWLPSDATSDADGIPYAEVKELLASLPARRVLLVSDACFAGGFLTRALGVKSKPPASAQESVEVSVDLTNNLNASREVITSGNIEEVPDSGTGFLAGHSPFSSTLLTSLEKVPVGAAISTTDLFVDLYRNLRSDASVKQRPQRGTLPGHNGGEFFMVRVARGSIQGAADRR